MFPSGHALPPLAPPPPLTSATRRPQNPYQTNLLLAGFDEGAGPSLYWMDYLATMHQMTIAGSGYGALPGP